MSSSALMCQFSFILYLDRIDISHLDLQNKNNSLQLNFYRTKFLSSEEWRNSSLFWPWVECKSNPTLTYHYIFTASLEHHYCHHMEAKWKPFAASACSHNPKHSASPFDVGWPGRELRATSRPGRTRLVELLILYLASSDTFVVTLDCSLSFLILA